MALSSTYIVRSWWVQDSVKASKGEVYSAERMGERGDPCSVPYAMPNLSDVWVPMRRDAVHSVRKESAQRQTLSGKLLPPEQAAELLPWYMQWSRDLASEMHQRRLVRDKARRA